MFESLVTDWTVLKPSYVQDDDTSTIYTNYIEIRDGDLATETKACDCHWKSREF